MLIPMATHPVMIVFLLCLAAGLASGAYPVIASGSLDMTPRYAGTVVGFQNCVANFSGILVPVVTGYVVKVSGWPAAFWLAASVCYSRVSGLPLLWPGQKARRLIGACCCETPRRGRDRTVGAELFGKPELREDCGCITDAMRLGFPNLEDNPRGGCAAAPFD